MAQDRRALVGTREFHEEQLAKYNLLEGYKILLEFDQINIHAGAKAALIGDNVFYNKGGERVCQVSDRFVRELNEAVTETIKNNIAKLERELKDHNNG